MTTEHSPAILIGQAATARIAALQQTLRRLREHDTGTTASRAAGPAEKEQFTSHTVLHRASPSLSSDAELPCE